MPWTPTTRRGWRTLRRRGRTHGVFSTVDQPVYPRMPAFDRSRRRHVPSSGAVRDVSTPDDPPPGRHHHRPAGAGARRVLGRPVGFGHLALTLLAGLLAGPLLTDRHECHVVEPAPHHAIRRTHPGRRGGL